MNYRKGDEDSPARPAASAMAAIDLIDMMKMRGDLLGTDESIKRVLITRHRRIKQRMLGQTVKVAKK